MRSSIATFFVALVLGLTGAASSPSVGVDPGASAAEGTVSTATAVVCTPAWGTPVVPIFCI